MEEHIHYFSLYSFLSLQHTILIVSLPIISWFQGPYRVWAIIESHIKPSYVVNENFNEHVLGKWKTDGLPVCIFFISFVNQKSSLTSICLLLLTCFYQFWFSECLLQWIPLCFFPSHHCNSFCKTAFSHLFSRFC